MKTTAPTKSQFTMFVTFEVQDLNTPFTPHLTSSATEVLIQALLFTQSCYGVLMTLCETPIQEFYIQEKNTVTRLMLRLMSIFLFSAVEDKHVV